MEASKISRLREEQLKAVSETDEKILQFEKFKADYKALQERLVTLPEKVTHDVMVPFGKLAFMPGQLVHTNEILVLLGDNWFAERSAKQACDITGRRMKELDKNIAELKEQRRLLEPRMGITSELQEVAEGVGDYKEIVEEYDEEKERLWDEQHKINVRRHHKKTRELRNASKQNDDDGKEARIEKVSRNKSEEDLWSRLDDLEKQETERGELNSSSESDDNMKSDRGQLGTSTPQDKDGDCQRKGNVSPVRDKRVNWIDDENEKDDEDSDDEATSEDDETEAVVKTITFRHSKTPSSMPFSNHEESATSKDGTIPNITSPGEIYKLFSPKPILKQTTNPSKPSPATHSVRFPNKTKDHCPLPSGDWSNETVSKSIDTESIDNSRDKAFTGIVKEKPVTSLSACSTPSTTTTQEQQPKRVSKFKAQRMGKNI